MIRFGPSGIPLSCKGRTLRDGVEDVHTLGLTAMEVQLVRVNYNDRFAGEEEIGLTPREIRGELVVEILRRGGRKEEKTSSLNEKIRQGDTLRALASGIARDYFELEEIGKLAKEMDIELSLHTPYYMDLANADGLLERSVESIKWSSMLAEALDAVTVVTHMGLYGGLSSKEALRRVASNLRSIRTWMKANKMKCRLGIESSGRQEVFGGLDEQIAIARNVKGIIPVVNLAHIHARGGGVLKNPEDFKTILDKAKKFTEDGHVHTHFSGVEHAGGDELRYTPIKRGDLRFEPLAECLLDGDYDVTLISSSPLLEHDAMYMKVILERLLAKRLAHPPRKRSGGASS